MLDLTEDKELSEAESDQELLQRKKLELLRKIQIILSSYYQPGCFFFFLLTLSNFAQFQKGVLEGFCH